MFHPGDVFRKWRNERGLTLVDFSKIAGIDKGTICRIENGASYRRPTFEKLCAAFGKSPLDVYAELLSASAGQAPISLSVCPDRNIEHEKYHQILESVLHGDDEKCIKAVTSVLDAVEDRPLPPQRNNKRIGNSYDTPKTIPKRQRVLGK